MNVSNGAAKVPKWLRDCRGRGDQQALLERVQIEAPVETVLAPREGWPYPPPSDYELLREAGGPVN